MNDNLLYSLPHFKHIQCCLLPWWWIALILSQTCSHTMNLYNKEKGCWLLFCCFCCLFLKLAGRPLTVFNPVPYVQVFCISAEHHTATDKRTTTSEENVWKSYMTAVEELIKLNSAKKVLLCLWCVHDTVVWAKYVLQGRRHIVKLITSEMSLSSLKCYHMCNVRPSSVTVLNNTSLSWPFAGLLFLSCSSTSCFKHWKHHQEEHNITLY